MSHQTGITGDKELRSFLGQVHSDKNVQSHCRAVHIIIKDESLHLKGTVKSISSWESDFDKTISSIIKDDQPCYILYRLDTKNSLGYEWLFISWSPDEAPVRQKMLYASTKATLKQEFGSSHLKDEYFCSTKDEATIASYKRHLKGDSVPAPLTEREEALRSLTIHDTVEHTASKQALGGVSFPMTKEAHRALLGMAKREFNYLQLKIDLNQEKIDLSKSGSISLTDLPKEVPTDAARYHLFLFKHTHEGDHLENIIFIYSMPGYNLPIKERMLYSSCKGPFLDTVQQLGIDVIKKIEIDDGKELTEDFLQDQLHPKRNLHRPAFAKPKGPPNRGAKRITKSQNP